MPKTETTTPPDEHTYLYVTCGRKAWHHGDTFKGWEEHDFDRGDYIEKYVFRKLTADLTDNDKKLVEQYGEEKDEY